MKAVQSLVYAFSGVNIFAKATASSMNSTASSAKQTSKSLSSVHSEINNVSDNSDNGSSGSVSPSMDLSQMDSEMSSVSQKLYDFFAPLKESWDKYGGALIEQVKTTAGQVVGLISSVWGSLENVITNGTIYTTLELILDIIGNIAEAFSNAWNYNGNGDVIVQNLANAFNNLLGAINNVVQSESFQNWLNNCSDKFREISEKLASIDWQPLVNALGQIGSTIGTIALDILSGLVDIFKWLVENPVVAEILLGIATAITLISTAINVFTTAMGIYNTVMPIAAAVSTALGISVGWLTAIVVAIVAAIALIVVAIMNWGSISEWFGNLWSTITEKIKEVWNSIKEFFVNLWNSIVDKVKEVWDGIKTTISNVINGIKTTISNILNAIKTTWSNIWNGIKTTISNIWNGIKSIITTIVNGVKDKFNAMKTTISNIFNSIKTAISNVWNSIWTTIKNVVNKVLGGIESFVNGIIKGINVLLSGISKVANAVGSLIGLSPISLQLSTISLPRLAKGNVAYDETLAIFGEYTGARNNPEITAPQSVLRDTFEDVLSNYEGNNNDRPIYLTINVGNKKLGQILLDDLRDTIRRTGKDIEALVGG